MGHPLDKHIEEDELIALAPLSADRRQKLPRLSPGAVREALRHIESCGACRAKLWNYRQLVNRSSNVVVSKAAPPRLDCPNDEDVDWHEVAAGLWPESKASQLIMHAALCDHCGPLLRAATSVSDDPSPEEETLLAQLQAPARPVVKGERDSIAADPAPPRWMRLLPWSISVPAIALTVLAAALATRPPSSPPPISGSNFAQFAMNTHRQHNQGTLALDVRSDSEQNLNEWLKVNSRFAVALPASPPFPGEERPYHLEGARLVSIAGKTTAYIAYQSQKGLVSLMVTPDSVTVASGGVEAHFTKVSFHYRMVEGYKVVTWSAQGLTYALVAQEGNRTQQSCMVCHSAMRDRDLSQTPTPLIADRKSLEPVLQ